MAACTFLMLSHAFIFTSCSSFTRQRDNNYANSPSQPTTVPKEQYDELVRKYQELLNQSKNQDSNKSNSVASAETKSESSNKGEQQVKPQISQATTIDPSELVNHLDQSVPDAKSSPDAVDALSVEAKKVEKKVGPPLPNSMAVEHVNNSDDIDDQIVRLREAQDLIKVNKFEQSLAILKELEGSKEKQIVVRAKVMLGDLLFNQGEYDLAMQVYEEIIKKYSFSGYVLKSLGRLVACSEKLKQTEKQAKYYSLLHDFFEAG